MLIVQIWYSLKDNEVNNTFDGRDILGPDFYEQRRVGENDMLWEL